MQANLIFLCRASKMMLGPLNLYAIKSVYQNMFDIPKSLAVTIAWMKKETAPTISSVRAATENSPQLFYKYKKRLILKGILLEDISKNLHFTFPRFQEYIRLRLLFFEK